MNRGIESTGERYLPWMGDYQLGYEHVHRYVLAGQVAAGKRVLDVACGEGYGTRLLSGQASFVIGADVDAITIAHAHHAHRRDNVRFLQMDARRFALAAHSIDVAVSFETLEHFSEQDEFLAEIKRVLSADGVLLISTPNSAVFSAGAGSSKNKFHERELGRSDFIHLLSSMFRNVQLFGQRCIAASMITGDQEGRLSQGPENFHPYFTEFDRTSYEYPDHAVQPIKSVYFIAICSDQPLPALCPSLLVDCRRMLWKQFAEERRQNARLSVLLRRMQERLLETTARLRQLESDAALERDLPGSREQGQE